MVARLDRTPAIPLADGALRPRPIDTTCPPASTAVQVAALFAPGYLIEADAWALVDD